MHGEELVGALLARQVVKVADERRDLGLGLLREEVAADAPAPAETLQFEAVVGDRVPVRDRRVELMERPDGAQSPST